MTGQILALLLTALLSGSCFGQARPSNRPSPNEQARAIAANSPVEVKFLDGSKLRGWISEVSDIGFVLSLEEKSGFQKSQVTFDQVKAVKQVKSVKPSQTTRNILIGVGVGVVVVASVLAAAVAASGGFGL